MATALRTSTVVFQLPHKGTWFENLAVRSDGTILATRVDTPEVWIIDPAKGTGSSLLKLPSPFISVTGITELPEDVFALGAGQYDLAKGAVPGSFAIFAFSLEDGTDGAQASLRKVVDTPDAGLINGLTTWDDASILAVDSTHGFVYKIDVTAGTSALAFVDDLTKPTPDAFVPIGINGVKVRGGYVYFTNTARAAFFRVPVDPASAKPTGPIETVASGFAVDDFAFDADGAAYIVTHPQNTVVKVAPGSSEAVTIAGKADSLELAGGTACAFGKGAGDARTLYVVTAGALAVPVNGEIEPAKLAAIKLD